MQYSRQTLKNYDEARPLRDFLAWLGVWIMAYFVGGFVLSAFILLISYLNAIINQ